MDKQLVDLIAAKMDKALTKEDRRNILAAFTFDEIEDEYRSRILKLRSRAELYEIELQRRMKERI